jgi:hypothetical protein
MESNWAVEHLQVIRTLMERSAIYRRALAPVMLAIGTLGVAAGLAGWFLHWSSTSSFAGYWCGVSAVGLCAAFLLVRRQALKDSDPFWSPPTRRVTQAMIPPLFAGWITVLAMFMDRWHDPAQAWWLPSLWMIFYGCALHAAGFFMPRGIRLFGWGFIVTGTALFIALSASKAVPELQYAHLVMAAVFGGSHLAYGAYLYLSEERKNAA